MIVTRPNEDCRIGVVISHKSPDGGLLWEIEVEIDINHCEEHQEQIGSVVYRSETAPYLLGDEVPLYPYQYKEALEKFGWFD